MKDYAKGSEPKMVNKTPKDASAYKAQSGGQPAKRQAGKLDKLGGCSTKDGSQYKAGCKDQ